MHTHIFYVWMVCYTPRDAQRPRHVYFCLYRYQYTARAASAHTVERASVKDFILCEALPRPVLYGCRFTLTHVPRDTSS